MRCSPILVVVLSLLGLAPSGVARAQLNPDLQAQVQQAIALTDERIALAQQLVAGCNSDQARSVLANAEQVQTQAKSVFSSATRDAELLMARDLTRRARELANYAIALARCCTEGDRIEAQLQRTGDVIERVRERVESCRQDRARAMLHAALELQAQARRAFAEGRCLMALNLTMRARERALNALRLCGFEDRLEDRVNLFLMRTDAMIDRARAAVDEHGGPQSEAALAQAVDLQGRAYAQFREGHFEASLDLSKAARAAVERAMRLARAGR